MIKNPFALIAERVKKSGDTMSGGLKVTAGGLEVCGRVYNSGDDEGIVVKPAPNNLAGLILGSNNGKRSVFYCRTAAATAPEWNYVDGNNNSSVIYHPAKSGTIALTSDITTHSINTEVAWGSSATISRSGANSMLITGGRQGYGFSVLIPNGAPEYVILSNVNSCLDSVSVVGNTITLTVRSSGYGSKCQIFVLWN